MIVTVALALFTFTQLVVLFFACAHLVIVPTLVMEGVGLTATPPEEALYHSITSTPTGAAAGLAMTECANPSYTTFTGVIIGAIGIA